MSASTPGTQEQSGLPRKKALLKALGNLGVIILVSLSVIWIREALRLGRQEDERTASLIFLLVMILVLTPTLYYSYRRGLMPSKPSRGLDTFAGILITCLAIGFVISASREEGQRRLFLDLVFAIVCFVEAGMNFYRAFKAKAALSLPS